MPNFFVIFIYFCRNKIMIYATNIHKSYGDLEVLKGVDLNIETSKIVSIVGPSGAGKTTLLHILGTLDRADNGNLFIDKKEVYQLTDRELAAFRNQTIGFVFQFHHLLPEFTALENIMMPALIARKSKPVAQKTALDLLDFLKLSERKDHKPSELSGGEQQRVAVARALINQPKIIFADEPSGNLDTENAKKLHELFFELRDKFKQTFVIVTHNENLAKMSDGIVRMKDGIIL